MWVHIENKGAQEENRSGEHWEDHLDEKKECDNQTSRSFTNSPQ